MPLFNPNTTGTVTSVAVTAPTGQITITGSPITASGTIDLSWVAVDPGLVFAGPTPVGPGNPSFRALVSADIPNLDVNKLTSGTLPVARGGTGLASATASGLLYGNGTSALNVLAPGSNGQVLKLVNGTPSWATDSASGTVTSISVVGPSELTITGSPITASGTIALSWTSQASGTMLAGPTSGANAAPAFRNLVATDFQSLAPTWAAQHIFTYAPAVGASTNYSVRLQSTVAATLSGAVLEIGLANKFDGTTGGFFNGNTLGTYIAINAPGLYAGNFVDLQANGVSKFSVSGGGNLTVAGTSNLTGAITGGSTLAITGTSNFTGAIVASGGATVLKSSAGTVLGSTYSSASPLATNYAIKGVMDSGDGIAGYFANANNFAYSGAALLKAELLNGTDSGTCLQLVNAGSGPYLVAGAILSVNKTTLSFFGATGTTQAASGATLTNNVTAGGTTNTLADFTSLTVYATDAAAIRNNIYQLGQKVKALTDALRNYGLLANN